MTKPTDADRTDRLVRIDGSLIEGDLTPEEAIAKKRALSEQGTSWRHHRWTGDHAGWCSVSGYDAGVQGREVATA